MEADPTNSRVNDLSQVCAPPRINHNSDQRSCQAAPRWPALTWTRTSSSGEDRYFARLKLEVGEAPRGADLAKRPHRRTIRGNDDLRILQQLGGEQVAHGSLPISLSRLQQLSVSAPPGTQQSYRLRQIG